MRDVASSAGGARNMLRHDKQTSSRASLDKRRAADSLVRGRELNYRPLEPDGDFAGGPLLPPG
jgi:hypothetical protein